MATTIKTKSSTTASAVPTGLSQGELAVNIADKKVWVGDAVGNSVQIAGNGATNVAGGSNTQVQYNSSGALAGSANLTFDGTTLTAAGLAGPFVDLNASGNVSFTSTGAMLVPKGTTAQRPTPTPGNLRFNSTTTQFEGYNGTAWGSIGGGATGGGSDQVFVQNDQIVTTTYAIPSGKNAMTTGPISINSGVTVTVPTGSRWVVL